ncbi:MAG: hypothetical protein AAGI88_08035 [Pseudomonadota bacterium]
MTITNRTSRSLCEGVSAPIALGEEQLTLVAGGSLRTYAGSVKVHHGRISPTPYRPFRRDLPPPPQPIY